MIRKIICLACCKKQRGLSREDVAQGWHQVVTPLIVKQPAVHGISVNGKFSAMDSIHCDLCDEAIADGDEAVAETHWRPAKEELPHWEEDFGVTDKAALEARRRMVGVNHVGEPKK